jgi:energy-coupling factor transporter ATP-binding protein EcfA2
MTSLSLRGVAHGSLKHADLELGPGLSVVLGRPSEGSDVLVEVLSGARRPRWGKVTLDGAGPARSPALRRRIGSLLAREQMPPGNTVADSLGLLLSIRGGPPATTALEAIDLGHWATRPSKTLSPDETRSVMLALALATTEPLALVLFEPLADVPGVPAHAVLERLEHAAALGACVVAVTASPADAVLMGGSLWLLERAGIVPSSASPWGLVPGSSLPWVVRTPSARALGACLLELPEVVEVEFEAARSESELRVRCKDPDRAGLIILGAARSAGIPVEALRWVAPTLDEIGAARAAAVRGAYERAYQSAREALPPMGASRP